MDWARIARMSHDLEALLPRPLIGAFCRRWRVRSLAVFGSATRGSDFRADSDVDLLVEFEPTADWSLWDLDRMEEELSAALGRPVDLVTRQSVEQSRNWLRRRAILDSAKTIYGG